MTIYLKTFLSTINNLNLDVYIWEQGHDINVLVGLNASFKYILSDKMMNIYENVNEIVEGLGSIH